MQDSAYQGSRNLPTRTYYTLSWFKGFVILRENTGRKQMLFALITQTLKIQAKKDAQLSSAPIITGADSFFPCSSKYLDV